jgi:signal transduction histidine kinase
MNLRRTENKARLALAFFVLALVLTLGVGLTLYSKSQRDLAAQRLTQVKLEAILVAAQLAGNGVAISEASLGEALRRQKLKASAGLYSSDGKLLARASTLEPGVTELPFAPRAPGSRPKPEAASSTDVFVRTAGDFVVAEVAGPQESSLVIAQHKQPESSPVIFYVLSYQIVALLLGLGLVFLLVRWLLRPYHRMVEAARGSPIRASPGMSESEFVVDTFRALVEQLHANERELANLHALERRRAEKSERFSERLISNIPSGLVTIDSRGFVTSANGQGLHIFGPGSYAEADENSFPNAELRLVDQDCATFFRAAPRMVEMISECLSSGTSYRREEVELVHPDGRHLHLGLSISPITDPSHTIEGALCLMTDLTEVIDLRERMKLKENLANLGEMAAGLAHEFKNSLATIHGYVQLLDAQSETSATAAARRSTLDAALNEVKLLARLVTDFLNFARPQSLHLDKVHLGSLLEDCVQEIRPHLSQMGIELSIRGRFADLPADDSMLRRAFVNLFRNAAEAIEPQSSVKRIEVTGSIDGGKARRYAHVRICDTGSGISPQDLHNIFIPFFTTKSRGYGIGLAIVQKILVAHGGDVSVERSDSSGTVFHCRLPLAAPTIVESE